MSNQITADPILAAIDARLAAVQEQLGGYAALKQEEARLLRAKQALTGDSAPAGGAAVAADAVFEAIPVRGEIKRAQLAVKLGVSRDQITAAIRELKAADRITTTGAGAGPVKRSQA